MYSGGCLSTAFTADCPRTFAHGSLRHPRAPPLLPSPSSPPLPPLARFALLPVRSLPKTELEVAAGDLCESCLAESTDGDGTGCDNETVVVIKFDFGDKSSAADGARVMRPRRVRPAADAQATPKSAKRARKGK